MASPSTYPVGVPILVFNHHHRRLPIGAKARLVDFGDRGPVFVQELGYLLDREILRFWVEEVGEPDVDDQNDNVNRVAGDVNTQSNRH